MLIKKFQFIGNLIAAATKHVVALLSSWKKLLMIDRSMSHELELVRQATEVQVWYRYSYICTVVINDQ